jgi:hypothetical protein
MAGRASQQRELEGKFFLACSQFPESCNLCATFVVVLVMQEKSKNLGWLGDYDEPAQ